MSGGGTNPTPTLNKQMSEDIKELITTELQQLSLISTAGAHVQTSATAVQAIFVAPKKCTVTDIKLGNTAAIAAHSTNHWTAQIVNQTGDLDLLSSAWNTDDDVAVTSNGKRALAADTMQSLNNNGTTEFLQNADLAEGDILILTLTKGGSATALDYPVATVRYKEVN